MDPRTGKFHAQINQRVLWIIRVSKGLVKYGTGFAIKSGLILTCAHLFTNFDQDCEISIRRVDKENEWFDAKIRYNNLRCDIVVLESKDDGANYPDNLLAEIAPLGQGRLTAGQSVMALDNYQYLLASICVGYVAHRFEDTEFLHLNDNAESSNQQTCAHYAPIPPYNQRHQMGSFWNSDYAEEISTTFEGGLDSRTPVIQISEFPHCGDGSGPSNLLGAGAPVFNSRGQVVGMMRKGIDHFVVAIHCGVLRQVLELFR